MTVASGCAAVAATIVLVTVEPTNTSWARRRLNDGNGMPPSSSDFSAVLRGALAGMFNARIVLSPKAMTHMVSPSDHSPIRPLPIPAALRVLASKSSEGFRSPV